MKRLIVVLLLSNVVTLLGVAVLGTVLVMQQLNAVAAKASSEREASATAQWHELEQQYRAALAARDADASATASADRQERQAALDAERRELERKYLTALAEAQEAKTAALLAEARARQAIADAQQHPATPPAQAQPQPTGPVNAGPPDGAGAGPPSGDAGTGSAGPEITHVAPPAPRPRGVAGWQLMWVDYNPDRPAAASACIDVANDDDPKGIRQMKVGETLRGWKLEAIEPARVRFVNADRTLQRVIISEGVDDTIDPNAPRTVIGPFNPRDFDPPAADPPTPTPTQPPTPTDGATSNSPPADTRLAVKPDGTVVPLPDVTATSKPVSDGVAAEAAAVRDLPPDRISRRMLTGPEMYMFKTKAAEVLQQPLFESVIDPSTGESTGMRLVRIPKQSIWSAYFKVDDILVSVNNIPLRSGDDLAMLPERAAEFTRGAIVRFRRDGETWAMSFSASPDLLAEYEKRLAETNAAKNDLLDAAAQRAREPGATPGTTPGTSPGATPGTNAPTDNSNSNGGGN